MNVPAAQPRVGIVLLNWNGADLTIPCLESLYNSSVPAWKILVVDNGSTDRSPDEIANRFPGVVLLRNKENVGFAAGNNMGIRRLLDDGAEYIWILNNDTRVDPDCLANLLEAMRADERIGAASGKIYFEDPPDVLWYAGAFRRRFSLRVPHRGLKQEDVGQFDEEEDVDSLSGCCMLVRASVLARVGLFRESYFAYNEDTEWCLRGALMGVRMRYVPTARLWHRQHSTASKLFGSAAGKSSPFQEYLQTRNAFWVIREHAIRPWQLITAVALGLAYRLKRAIGLLVLGKGYCSLAILRGIRHGLLKPLEPHPARWR